MISQQGYVQRTLLNGTCEQPVQWQGVGGAGTPTKTYGEGITSIARSGAGNYLITFAEQGYQIPQFYFSVTDTAAGGKWTVQMDQWSSANKTILIYTLSNGAATDLPTTASLNMIAWQVDTTQT